MIIFWIFFVLVVLFGFVVAFGAPYVPSLHGEVRNAFEKLYRLSGDDVVVDLGSGDGQILVEAARRGAHGYGYELNPVLVAISRWRLRGKADVHMKDMWSVMLPESTTLVYVFAVSRDSLRLGTFLQRQADVLGRDLNVMTFGSGLKGHEPVAVLKAHSLYRFTPRVKR